MAFSKSVNIKTGCRGCEECENVIPSRGIARTTTILSTTLSLDTAFTHDNSSSANFLPPQFLQKYHAQSFYPNLFCFISLISSFLSIFRWFCSSSFIVFHSFTSWGLLSFSASRMYFSIAEQRKSASFSSCFITLYSESCSNGLSLG